MKMQIQLMRNEHLHEKKSELRLEDIFIKNISRDYILQTLSFTIIIKMSNFLNLNSLWENKLLKIHILLSAKSNIKE